MMGWKRSNFDDLYEVGPFLNSAHIQEHAISTLYMYTHHWKFNIGMQYTIPDLWKGTLSCILKCEFFKDMEHAIKIEFGCP